MAAYSAAVDVGSQGFGLGLVSVGIVLVLTKILHRFSDPVAEFVTDRVKRCLFCFYGFLKQKGLSTSKSSSALF